jgi:hypothetical protein
MGWFHLTLWWGEGEGRFGAPLPILRKTGRFYPSSGLITKSKNDHGFWLDTLP